ncbi:phospholipase D-like domain-containing protein [Halorussus salilacus]|uniref:phospholipase D-like domain-containing protein n=1 Tax=Halorussus salilacus TaxID=2953750 RepID=UPI00209EE361|nr:phospholipase D-like domain-containing protein [Halorussus salilacus]USZ68819.1 phospholipase D-like domain-containing protein [Halorussus salilacus]
MRASILVAVLLVGTVVALAGPVAAAGATAPAAATGPSTAAVGPGASDVSGDSGASDVSAPEIVAVYPNPATPEDAGEFVVVRVPRETNVSGWVLEDDETAARLPNVTVSGEVALSTDPEVARNRTERRVLGLSGHLSLANGGDTVRLVPDDSTATTGTGNVTYPRAPEGERWNRTDGEWSWEHLGATDFEVGRAGPADARAFVLPDSPAVPLETVRSADERLLLAGYTFTSERVADALDAARERGVEVRVLVEGGPVGGQTRRQARVLDGLADRGIEVRVVDGPLARYDFHHPKYAVADDRALVLTENWKPAGTGGAGSRGWGVALDSPAAADHLADVFAADAGWRDSVPWTEFREDRRFEEADPANGSYPAEIPPETLPVESADVLVAPENAEDGMVGLLDSADESIRVQQAGIGGRDQPFLRAALRAADRGVEVRVLLSGAWYVEEENAAMVEWLNERADDEDLQIEARLADPRGRYEKVHAKGVVVDGESAVVGSLNWNNNSARQNREVAVVLHGEEVAGFYAGAFDADWQASADGGKKVPFGLLVGVAVGALAALLLARREVHFEREV